MEAAHEKIVEIAAKVEVRIGNRGKKQKKTETKTEKWVPFLALGLGKMDVTVAVRRAGRSRFAPEHSTRLSSSVRRICDGIRAGCVGSHPSRRELMKQRYRRAAVVRRMFASSDHAVLHCELMDNIQC